MAEQLFVSISAEYGSGGDVIAQELAKRFGIPMYDRNLLDHIAQEKNGDVEELRKYDQKPRNYLVSRTVKGYSNSPEEIIAGMQFEYFRKKAAEGKSFVALGRCAESVLQEYKQGLVTVFVTADMEAKIKRVQEVRGMTRKEAKAAIVRHNWNRKNFFNRYSDSKWGASQTHDICINTTRLGIEKTVDLLEYYIRGRQSL